VTPPLRLQLRQFISENLPTDWRDATSGALDDESLARIRREWGQRLHAGGWAAPTLGTAAGGLGLSGDDLVAYLEELVGAGAPEVLNSNAIGILAPVLEVFGTPGQRAGALPAMLAHQTIWCQGFSEPDAGSDLAHLRTRAVQAEGGGWLVSGQKAWTSNALHADRCYLLARTNPDAEAHSGLSLLLLDMRQPGVEVRPLRNMAGTLEFCEVFLDNALVRAEDLVGQPGDGWRLATYALEQERASMLGQRALRMSRELAAAYELLGPEAISRVERELGRVHAAIRASEALVRRTLALLGADLPAGVLAPVAKLFWSETHQQLLDVVADGVGPEFFSERRTRPWAQAMLFARAETIYGGTSEIQRNMIARLLGLPGSGR
jgi:alkylation response protein AidB-like acyl-CoA dehydrogenase